MADTPNLTGFKELAAALRQLPKKLAKNGLRAAVGAGAAVIRKGARARARVDTGEMRKDIQIKRERDTPGGDTFTARYSVFVRSGKKSRLSGRARNIQKDSFYWKFLEFGTSKMAARPFLRPAFEADKEQAVQVIGEKLDEKIQAAAMELHR